MLAISRKIVFLMFCCGCVMVLFKSVSKEKRRRLIRNQYMIASLVCHITVECTSMDQEAAGQLLASLHHLTCSPVGDDGSVSDYSYQIHLPSNFVQLNKKDLFGGSLFVDIPGGEITKGSVWIPENSVITRSPVPESFQARHLRFAETSNRTVLVLRVGANDSTVNNSAQEIYDFVFHDARPSLKSQYAKLSFGKLNFVPTQYGVLDINIGENAIGAPSAIIRDAAISAVTAKLGVTTITSLADHVMICLPPGTLGRWSGSSPLRSWRIVLNNRWCGYLSGLMHEMGHNLGLLHSNEGGTAYLDYTSYMSAAFSVPYYPSKSFNGANNWQLGWYNDRAIEIDPRYEGTVITLATFVDYGKANKRDPVLIKVGNGTFLQYNRAKGFNYETQDMIDQVTIVVQESNGTSLLGGINASNPQFTISNFETTGRNLVFSVCSSGCGNDRDPDWMSLGIGFSQNYCMPKAATERTSVPLKKPEFWPSQTPSNAPSVICEDNDDAVFPVNNIQRRCSWLKVRPSLWGRICVPGNRAYDVCRNVCKACHSSIVKPSLAPSSSIRLLSVSPSFTPTFSPLPTTVPTIETSTSQCYDSPIAKFAVNATFGSKTCIWLASRPQWQEQLCLHDDAKAACPRTCRVCNSTCDDQNGTFLISGSLRDCRWLSLRFFLWKTYCPLPEVSRLCPVTCHTCP